MIVYVDRDMSEEFAVSNLYEDSRFFDVEVELPDAEYQDLLRANKAYWAWQEKLAELYEKSPRRDRR